MSPQQTLEFNQLKEKYPEIRKLPDQTGLEILIMTMHLKEIENVRYQLSMMIFKVPGMKDELKLRIPNLTDIKINNIENIINFCERKIVKF